MKTLVLALLALPLLSPLAAADHVATCGAADGTVVDGLAMWLRPGCLGALAYLPPKTCAAGPELAHGHVLGVRFYADLCSAGAWLP